jgi:1-acyl-sn-glycerol-3-phosphate acyltransferase
MSLPLEAAPANWQPPTLGEILCRPVPDLGPGDRTLLRILAVLARDRVRVHSGLEHIGPSNDPFILVLNHSTRREALLVPAVLTLHRGGRLIHFLADWNFRLIPGLGLLYRRGQTVTVTRKPARPAFLNIFKPLYREPQSVLERTRSHLLAGKSVGIFPEARVNRDSERLLKGRIGAACLSLETGVPVVPAGIRLLPPGDGTAGVFSPLEIRIGAPLRPPRPARAGASTAELRAWQAVVMAEIARLSGKSWDHGKEEQRCATTLASRRAA